MEVNRDAGLEPGETFCLCLSRLDFRVPIYLLCPDPPRLTIFIKQILKPFHSTLLPLPRFSHVSRVEVTVNPGDVLFVPNRWWHHVENLQLSVSVNTWIEIPEDVEARCKEAIVKTLYNTLLKSREEEDRDYEEMEEDGEGGEEGEDEEEEDEKEEDEGEEEEEDEEDEDEEKIFYPTLWVNPSKYRSSVSSDLRTLNLAMDQHASHPAPKTRKDDGEFNSLRIETCRCFQFHRAETECDCEPRITGELLKPIAPEVGRDAPKENHDCLGQDGSSFEIDCKELLDVLTSDEVVQTIFDKLNVLNSS